MSSCDRSQNMDNDGHFSTQVLKNKLVHSFKLRNETLYWKKFIYGYFLAFTSFSAYGYFINT